MTQIRYMNKSGDETKQVTVEEAREVVAKEIDAGNLVLNQDEKAIVEKATMGKINGGTRLAVFPAVAGG